MFFFKFLLTLLWRRPLSYRNQSIDLLGKSMDWFLDDNGLHHERVKLGKKWRKMLSPLYSLNFKNIILFLNRGLYFFSNGHIRNVVSTLPNVVKIDVENDNVVSTLSNVVQFNVEKHNVVSTLFCVVNFNVDIHNVVSTLNWRCATSRRHINLKTTLNRLEMFAGINRYTSRQGIYIFPFQFRVLKFFLEICLSSRFFDTKKKLHII